MVARLPAGRRGGDRVTCLAAECLTYFFFLPVANRMMIYFRSRGVILHIRTTCDGERLRFYFLSTEKRTKSFSTPYNAYNTYALPYRVNILLSISSWATASLYSGRFYMTRIHLFSFSTPKYKFRLRGFHSYFLYIIYFTLYCQTFGRCYIIIIFHIGPRTV